MSKTLAIALGLFTWGSVAAAAHQLDQPQFGLSGYTWNLYVAGDEAKLAYGAPNTDLVGVMMTCQRGSDAVIVSGDVAPERPTLVLASGKKVVSLSGPAESDPFGGGLYMEARASTHDAAIARFARTGDLALVRSGHQTDMRASMKARGDIRRFFAHCEA